MPYVRLIADSIILSHTFATLPHKHKPPCETLSVMDAISQYQLGGISTEDNYFSEENNTYGNSGGSPDELLKILQKNGICSAQMAPYYIFQDNSSLKANWDLLVDSFQNLREADTNGKCDNQFIDGIIREITRELSFIEGDSSVMDENRVIGAISEPNSREFLKAILVPDQCIENRKIYDFEIERHNDADYSSSKEKKVAFKWHIASNLSEETPLLINIKCGRSADVCEGDGNHSIIIKGMRQNKHTGKCELLILNSWGKKWQDKLNGGYVDANQIMEDTYEIMWLK